eukprot:TRINITY_DN1150_c0_g1_i1.p1 TRINITY_DN1150_c0_g1~~TRINITY_DN1150_c0_g1_i1.p1  ORF type:complete len:230 (+),score=61.58 TRINITY_DN1150_c0_g1_i1:30-692(+)
MELEVDYSKHLPVNHTVTLGNIQKFVNELVSFVNIFGNNCEKSLQAINERIFTVSCKLDILESKLQSVQGTAGGQFSTSQNVNNISSQNTTVDVIATSTNPPSGPPTNPTSGPIGPPSGPPSGPPLGPPSGPPLGPPGPPTGLPPPPMLDDESDSEEEDPEELARREYEEELLEEYGRFIKILKVGGSPDQVRSQLNVSGVEEKTIENIFRLSEGLPVEL